MCLEGNNFQKGKILNLQLLLDLVLCFQLELSSILPLDIHYKLTMSIQANLRKFLMGN